MDNFYGYVLFLMMTITHWLQASIPPNQQAPMTSNLQKRTTLPSPRVCEKTVSQSLYSRNDAIPIPYLVVLLEIVLNKSSTIKCAVSCSRNPQCCTFAYFPVSGKCWISRFSSKKGQSKHNGVMRIFRMNNRNLCEKLTLTAEQPKLVGSLQFRQINPHEAGKKNSLKAGKWNHQRTDKDNYIKAGRDNRNLHEAGRGNLHEAGRGNPHDEGRGNPYEGGRDNPEGGRAKNQAHGESILTIMGNYSPEVGDILCHRKLQRYLLYMGYGLVMSMERGKCFKHSMGDPKRISQTFVIETRQDKQCILREKKERFSLAKHMLNKGRMMCSYRDQDSLFLNIYLGVSLMYDRSHCKIMTKDGPCDKRT